MHFLYEEKLFDIDFLPSYFQDLLFSLSISILMYANIKYTFVFAGLDVDGIYRVSGNLATIQKLRFIVNQGKSFPHQICFHEFHF